MIFAQLSVVFQSLIAVRDAQENWSSWEGDEGGLCTALAIAPLCCHDPFCPEGQLRGVGSIIHLTYIYGAHTMCQTLF